MAASETELWSKLAPTATESIGFWNAFLDVRKGANATLSPDDVANLLRIVRAVCWVESKHGTGGGSSAQDPMQCGNPADAWWPQVAGSGSAFDRYVRGPKFTKNYDANELDAAVSSEANWPSLAKLSQLADAKQGHRDAGFSPTMSLFWGVPHLMWKTNVQRGGSSGKAFLFKDVSRAELLGGAVAYNGGGDADYETKIDKALTDAGWSVSSPLDELAAYDSMSLTATLAAALATLDRQVGASRLFPHGLASISLSVITPDQRRYALKVRGHKADRS